MTAKRMRAVAAGLLIIAAAFILFDLFQSYKLEAANETIPQIQLSSEEMMENLKKQGFVILEETEYDILLKAKEEAAKETGKQLNSDENEEPVQFSYLIIKRGMSGSEVASLLEQAEIIESKEEFVTYLQEKKLTTSIQTGQFLLNSGMTFDEIIDEIT